MQKKPLLSQHPTIQADGDRFQPTLSIASIKLKLSANHRQRWLVSKHLHRIAHPAMDHLRIALAMDTALTAMYEKTLVASGAE